MNVWTLPSSQKKKTLGLSPLANPGQWRVPLPCFGGNIDAFLGLLLRHPQEFVP